MDAIIKALLYLILFLAIITLNVWFVRALAEAYLREHRPLVIAPFQVIGKEDAGGKQGTALASMLLARLARIRQEMEASATALTMPRERTGAATIQTLDVSDQAPLSVPERLFAPLNINMTVGGVEVGGLLSWAQRALSRDQTLQIAVQYDGERAIAVTHLDGSDKYSLWIESKAASEQVVSDIAYALTHREFARRVAEVEALDVAEFRSLLSTLNRAAELNRQVARGRAARESYAQLLPPLEELMKKAPSWKALFRLSAQIADNAGESARAVALYGRELELTEQKDTRYAEIKERIEGLNKRIAAAAAPVAAAPGTQPPPTHPVSGDGDVASSPSVKWTRDMLGVPRTEAASPPSITVLGDPPSPGTLPADRLTVLRIPARPTAGGDSESGEYERTIVQAVQLVAANTRFTFAPVGLQEGGTTHAGILTALNAAVGGKPSVLLVTLGPLQGAAFEVAFQAAVDAGIVVVIAAGNNAGEPAALADTKVFKNLMVVAAVDAKGARSKFTQHGKGVFWAPGENIVLEPRQGKKAVRAGTSYSAALAAGVAARLVAERPGLPVQAVLDALRTTAQPVAAGGEPVLNLNAALAKLPASPRS
jgi:subtilisin family serine protease